MGPFAGGAGRSEASWTAIGRTPTGNDYARAACALPSRRRRWRAASELATGGLTASAGCRCREEARAGLARVASVSGTERRVRARELALEGAAIFHVHAVLRSAARTLHDPSDSPLAGLEAAAATETAPHLPHPFPRPPPDRARLVPHPRPPACLPARPLRRRHVGAGPDARYAGPANGHLSGR